MKKGCVIVFIAVVIFHAGEITKSFLKLQYVTFDDPSGRNALLQATC